MVMDPGYEICMFTLMSVSLFLAILALNWLLTFHKLWKLFKIGAISMRRPKAVMLINTLCIMGLLRNALQVYLSTDIDLFHRMYLIQSMLAHMTTLATLSSIVYRTWLVYYDIKFNQALEAEQWQTQIDTETLKHSWYIEKRRQYRNPTKVAIVLFIPWCLFTVIGTLSVVAKGRNPIALMAFALNMGVPPILLIILLCKMPQYDDHYKLRRESEMQSLIGICGIALLVVTIVSGAGPGDVGWLAVQFFHSSILIGVTITSLYWVLRAFKLPALYCRVNAYQPSVNLLEDAKTHSAGAVAVNMDIGGTGTGVKESVNKFKSVDLIDVFKDEELFNLYATYLSKEFAIENLLFFVETHQFAQYLADKCDVVLQKPGIDDFELSADNIPKCTIVKDLNSGGRLNDAAIHLFQKYIDYEEAYFCVNVSFEARTRLYDTFGYLELKNAAHNVSKQEAMNAFMKRNNTNAKQIYDAFQDSRAEIYDLLLSSFLLFKKMKASTQSV